MDSGDFAHYVKMMELVISQVKDGHREVATRLWRDSLRDAMQSVAILREARFRQPIQMLAEELLDALGSSGYGQWDQPRAIRSAEFLLAKWVEAEAVLTKAPSTRSATGVSGLVAALKRFPDAATRLRVGRDTKPGRGLTSRVPYAIGDEYDFQDALWLFLRMSYATAIDEDPTGKYAGKSSKMDFSVPELAAALELKYLSPTQDPKQMKKDLLVDLADIEKTRPDIKTLVVAIGEPLFGRGADLEHLSRASPAPSVVVVRIPL